MKSFRDFLLLTVDLDGNQGGLPRFFGLGLRRRGNLAGPNAFNHLAVLFFDHTSEFFTRNIGELLKIFIR